jgi:hypothetical protein
MKKYIKTISCCLAIITLSCSEKEGCEYDNEENVINGCIESTYAGYMVTTMGAKSSNSDVGIIYNAQNTYQAPLGNDWDNLALGLNRVSSIRPAMWKANVIGNVFGIALDNANGIYLSATNIYISDGFMSFPTQFGSAGGSAGIYYTNMANPNTTTTLVKTLNNASANTVGTATIPNTGVGYNSIGNIAYDKVNNQLFATNLEDGRIYRINPTTGIIKSIFDPFAIDNGVAGTAPVGEQLWGIGVLNEGGTTAVYFARSNSPNKEIWSVKLDASGEFIATEVGTSKLFNDSASSSVLQIANVRGTQNKITDIAFSSTGRMMVAERGNPHAAQAFEYVRSGTSWIAGNNFYSGGNAGNDGQNCAGGVDYGNSKRADGNITCDDLVWTSSNFMFFGTNNYYGVQGIKATGNSLPSTGNLLTNYFIDFNGTYSTDDKGGVGDVEIFDTKCKCNN